MSDQNEIRYFCFSNVGISGTTPVTIKESKDGFEARMGVALMGYSNMDEDEFRAAQYNPFHEKFHDNFVSGKGETQESAIKEMKRDHRDMCDSLWA